MIAKVALPTALAAQILSEAGAAFPRECCGLLEGLRDGGTARVAALHPVRNLAADADRFAMNPKDQFAAQKAARANGRSIIGCYHSHPGGGTEASATDAAGAGEDDFVWLIAAGGTLAAHVYFGGGFSGVVIGADCVTSSG